MTDKGIKLTEAITAHAVFEENQVLTAGQLNGLADYLDRQDRLTRARLIGIGILCGLSVLKTRRASL